MDKSGSDKSAGVEWDFEGHQGTLNPPAGIHVPGGTPMAEGALANSSKPYSEFSAVQRSRRCVSALWKLLQRTTASTKRQFER